MDYKTLNDAASMVDVLAAYGIQTDTRRHVARCPFHDDNRPSLHIYPHSFYCFACGAGGDVIQFIKRMENCTAKEAAEKVTQITGQGAAAVRMDYRTRRRMDERKRAEMAADKLLDERNELDREMADAQRLISESEPFGVTWQLAWHRYNDLLRRDDELREKEIINNAKRTDTRP